MAATETENKQEFDTATQDQAYFELCQIIAEALQAQDLQMLQVAIYYWENQYPVEKFDSFHKEKVKRLLSNEYLSWLAQYIQELSNIARRCKEFDPVKAYDRLIKILVSEHGKGNYDKLKEKIEAWQIAYPMDKFSSYYQSKINEKINEKYLQKAVELFSEKTALTELDKIINSTNNISELKCKIRDWKQQFPDRGFSSKNKDIISSKISEASYAQSKNAAEDLKTLVGNISLDIQSGTKDINDLYIGVSNWQNQNRFEDIEEHFTNVIKELTDKGYLKTNFDIQNQLDLPTTSDIPMIMKHSGPLNQEKACLELTNALLTSNYSQKVLDWIYKYDNYIKYFDDYHIGYILEKTDRLFRIPKSGIKAVSEIDVNNSTNLSDARKAVTVQFLSHLYHKKPLLDAEKNNLKSIYAQTIIAEKKKTEKEEHVDEIKEAITLINNSIYSPIITKQNLVSLPIINRTTNYEPIKEEKIVVQKPVTTEPEPVVQEPIKKEKIVVQKPVTKEPEPVVQQPIKEEKEIVLQEPIMQKATILEPISSKLADNYEIELNNTANKELLDFTFKTITDDFADKKIKGNKGVENIDMKPTSFLENLNTTTS